MPNTLQNPYEVDIPPDPNIPTAPPLLPVPPPSNPLAAYVAPLMIPQCPYNSACPDGDSSCVGYNSWGFSEVRMSRYSPGTRFFNAIYCLYVMKPYDVFKIPVKIKGYWELQDKEAREAAPTFLRKNVFLK